MMKSKRFSIFAAILLLARALPAAIIGTNVPATPLTVERIAELSKTEQTAWQDYLRRSQKQMQADKDFLAKEMRQHGLKASTSPGEGHARGRYRNHTNEWFGSAEARQVAENIISYQTPAGGWSKNFDMTSHRRAPGERFAAANVSANHSAMDYDEPLDVGWNYVGTFDNEGTITQLRFLARVIAAGGTNNVAAEREAFLRGLEYIFAAQYPNGGWPQVWPLQGGYHDAVTFNDGAMVNVLNLLREVSLGTNEFRFVPVKLRKRAATRMERGVECLLKSQIVVDGRRTVWCQQHDVLTLRPASARNYEMPSQSAAESAGIISFLMKLPDPGTNVVAAINAGAAWLEKTQIKGFAFKKVGDEGRELTADADAGVIWARYYEIGSDRPIFGDRDKTIHDTVEEISKERRNGYAWYSASGKEALKDFVAWRSAHSR